MPILVMWSITNSVLNSPCFAWHSYGKLELFKTELVIAAHILILHCSVRFSRIECIINISDPDPSGWDGFSIEVNGEPFKV